MSLNDSFKIRNQKLSLITSLICQCQSKVKANEILTQFRNDFLYADLAPVHQFSDSVQAFTEWLLCFFEAEQKYQVKNNKEHRFKKEKEQHKLILTVRFLHSGIVA